MITNPSLDRSYVVLNFWPNLSLVVLIKLSFFLKKACRLRLKLSQSKLQNFIQIRAESKLKDLYGVPKF